MSDLIRFANAAQEEFGAKISVKLLKDCEKSWVAASEILGVQDAEQAKTIHHGAFFAGVAMAQEEAREQGIS